MSRLLRRAALSTFAALMPERAATWFERALLRPRPAPLLDAGEPRAAMRERRVPYGWGWLTVRTWGDSARPTILLVHGWGGTSRGLAAFIDPFVLAGYRVVACDLPAHGAAPGERTNLIECGGAVLQVGAASGPLAGVVGHSFGGAAAALAVAHGLPVNRLVMIGAPIGMREISFPVADRLGVPRALSQRMFDGFATRLGFTWDEIGTPSLVARVAAPLLVIHDDRDDVVPFAHGQAIARAAPAGRLVTTSGRGHRGVLVDPGVVRSVVDFISG